MIPVLPAWRDGGEDDDDSKKKVKGEKLCRIIETDRAKSVG